MFNFQVISAVGIVLVSPGKHVHQAKGLGCFKGLQLFDEEEGLKFIVTSCLGETLLHFIQALVNLLCPLPVGSV